MYICHYPIMSFIDKNKQRGRGKKRSEKGEGKRNEEEARGEEGTYVSFSVSIFISAMLRLGAGGVVGSFSFSLLFFSLFLSLCLFREFRNVLELLWIVEQIYIKSKHNSNNKTSTNKQTNKQTTKQPNNQTTTNNIYEAIKIHCRCQGIHFSCVLRVCPLCPHPAALASNQHTA